MCVKLCVKIVKFLNVYICIVGFIDIDAILRNIKATLKCKSPQSQSRINTGHVTPGPGGLTWLQPRHIASFLKSI